MRDHILELDERPVAPGRQPGSALPNHVYGGGQALTLPTGTITFVLTDIEGSTRLWDTQPAAMRAATQRHDALIEAIASRKDGVVVRPRGEGDSRFIVFERATDAAAAAIDLQRALQTERWELAEPLSVRVALHTGEADLRDGDYYGTAINRCARLRTLAHGGQILLSGATHDVVQDSPDGWPAGSLPRSLGVQRLAGLARPERVYELVVSGLRSEFPPLAITHAARSNLPVQLTTFVGREHERARLEQHLLDRGVRLVTLTGPGGVGKTRLALHVAGALLDEFEDGVLFVSLVATRRPELVPSAIAQALGIVKGSARPVLETIIDKLADKTQLLVLDNFEHVLDAASGIAALLRGCPGIKILVTSRSLLRLTGEHVFELEPLDVPAADASLPELESSEAVRLFVDRARATNAGFTVSPDTLAEVASICRRLDGLPLAIELVAARVREFSAPALSKHLAARRLPLLTHAPRDAPTRHVTLRSAIDWSYQLLTSSEQALFRRIAVFDGGMTPALAQAVADLGDDPLDTFEGLASLVDKSLLRAHPADDGPRFFMLETVREYALEQLEHSGEVSGTAERHARAFENVLRQAADQRGGPHEATWLRILGLEHANLRAAMTCALEQGHVEQALRMADNVWWFLLTYGFTQEGADWLEQVLALSADKQSPLRARVLVGAGRLADQLGDLAAAETSLQEALGVARSAGDRQLLDLVLGGLSFVLHRRGDFDRAIAIAEENVQVASQLADQACVAHAYTRLAELLVLTGHVSRGATIAELATELSEGIGDLGCLAAGLDTLGLARYLSGSPQAAAELLERAVQLHREFGWRANTAEALFRWADALVLLGNVDRASVLCAEGLRLAREAGSRRRIARGLRLASVLVHHTGDHVEGARLAAAAARVYAQLGGQLNPVDNRQLEAVLQLSAESLGESQPAAIRERFTGEAIEAVILGALRLLSTAEGSPRRDEPIGIGR